MEEGVNPFKIVDIHDLPKVIFPSGQPRLEGKMTFGDPFEDSGVVWPGVEGPASGSARPCPDSQGANISFDFRGHVPASMG